LFLIHIPYAISSTPDHELLITRQVPFEHKAPLGFYEVDGEHSIVPQQNLLNVRLTLNPKP